MVRSRIDVIGSIPGENGDFYVNVRFKHLVTLDVRSATLSGIIEDPAGRIVIGAAVTALEVATNQKYESKSNETGNFSAPYLPGGTYTVTVATEEFETASRTGIAPGTGERVQLEIALKVGTAH